MLVEKLDICCELKFLFNITLFSGIRVRVKLRIFQFQGTQDEILNWLVHDSFSFDLGLVGFSWIFGTKNVNIPATVEKINILKSLFTLMHYNSISVLTKL